MHRFAEKIAECVKAKVEAVGMDDLSLADLNEIGQWIDIAKDLTEYDKNMRVIEAMDEEQEDSYGRMGYDRYRYADGRFAPKGRGHRMGYRPYLYMGEDDWLNEYTHNPDFMKPGYTERGKMDSRHGRSYDRFDENRRFYHESGDTATKKRMEDSIKDVFDDMESMVQDVWKDMTPEQKTQYRAKMTQLVQKMQ